MISLICKKYGIINYTVNDDGSIDVDGDVDLYRKGLIELPLRFNKVTGSFDCGDNNLTSLKGCPRWLGTDFCFSYNKLTSLKVSPRWIGGFFSCINNRLTSLEFCPDYVGGDFYCTGNKLTDNYCDTEIGGGFYTSLEQDGLTEHNYNEWRKLYKRKLILNQIFDI